MALVDSCSESVTEAAHRSPLTHCVYINHHRQMDPCPSESYRDLLEMGKGQVKDVLSLKGGFQMCPMSCSRALSPKAQGRSEDLEVEQVLTGVTKVVLVGVAVIWAPLSNHILILVSLKIAW